MRGAATAFLLQNALGDKSVDFARGGVLRHLAYLRPFGRREIALENVPHQLQSPQILRILYYIISALVNSHASLLSLNRNNVEAQSSPAGRCQNITEDS